MLDIKKLLIKICQELKTIQAVSFIKLDVGTTTKNVTLPNSFRGVMWVTDSTGSRCGEYIVCTNLSGVPSYKTISSASDITIGTSTNNTLSLTASTGTRWVMIQSINGTASV